MSAPVVTTDLLDYAAGETANITASHFTVGSTVEFQVLHVLDAGADGIYGTADDTLDGTLNGSGAGHTPWYVTDGVRVQMAGADGIQGTADDYWWGDLDGIANGAIVTSWYVNPDDSAGATFLLSAKGVDVGADGIAGTGDDVATGEVAMSSFTDTPGSYNLDFKAANPTSYIPPIPFPNVSAIPGATYGTAVPSLAPAQMALGQVVPFEIKITVNGLTTPENGVINFTAGWSTQTTNGNNFGFDPTKGVINAFIDTSDPANHDPGNNASVSFTWTVVAGEIQGHFVVSGLDNGDVIIVEPWLVLDSTIPAGATGHVQSELINAYTG